MGGAVVDALVDAEVESRADQGDAIRGDRDICSPNMFTRDPDNNDWLFLRSCCYAAEVDMVLVGREATS